jgi:hypothetical protein
MKHHHSDNEHDQQTMESIQVITRDLSSDKAIAKVGQERAATIIPGLFIPNQLQSNWCWLACSVGIHNFYAPNDQGSQCQLAAILLGKSCCNSPLPTGCNVPGLPSTALSRMNNLASKKVIYDLTFPAIQTEIRANRPIILGYTEPNQNQGHAIVVCGFENPGTVGAIDPQIGGFVYIKFSDLLFEYGKHNSEVCFTKK